MYHPTGLSFFSFISLHEEPSVPLCSRKIYSNDKPWFSAHLRRLRSEREVDRFRQPRYRFAKAVREAKHRFKEKPLSITERSEVVRLSPLPS